MAFFLIYLFSGILGNAASFAFNDLGVLSGGASTSLFGLFGALFVLGFHFKNNSQVRQLIRHYMLFIVISFVFGLTDTSVDIWGHLGGIVGGLLIGNIIGLPQKVTNYSIHQNPIYACFWISLIICVLLGLKNYGLLV